MGAYVSFNRFPMINDFELYGKNIFIESKGKNRKILTRIGLRRMKLIEYYKNFMKAFNNIQSDGPQRIIDTCIIYSNNMMLTMNCVMTSYYLLNQREIYFKRITQRYQDEISKIGIFLKNEGLISYMGFAMRMWMREYKIHILDFKKYDNQGDIKKTINRFLEISCLRCHEMIIALNTFKTNISNNRQ